MVPYTTKQMVENARELQAQGKDVEEVADNFFAEVTSHCTTEAEIEVVAATQIFGDPSIMYDGGQLHVRDEQFEAFLAYLEQTMEQ